MNRFNFRPAAEALGIALVVEVLVLVVVFASIGAIVAGMVP